MILADVNGADARAVAEEIGPAAEAVMLDVSSEVEWQELAQALGSGNEGIDVLVNNAGIGIGGDITKLFLQDWRRQQSTKLDGAFLGIKHMLPLIRRSGRAGAIINIASVTGIRGSGCLYPMQRARAV